MGESLAESLVPGRNEITFIDTDPSVVGHQMQRPVLGRLAVDLAQQVQAFGTGAALLTLIPSSAVILHVRQERGRDTDPFRRR